MERVNVLGDSNAIGTVNQAPLSDFLPGWEIVNHAVSGSTSAWSLMLVEGWKQSGDLPSGSWCVISTGGNDLILRVQANLAAGRALNDWGPNDQTIRVAACNIMQIRDILKGAGNEVLTCRGAGTFWEGLSQLQQEMLQAVDEGYNKLALRTEVLWPSSVAFQLPKEVEYWTMTFLPGVHASIPFGYRYIAERIAGELNP